MYRRGWPGLIETVLPPCRFCPDFQVVALFNHLGGPKDAGAEKAGDAGQQEPSEGGAAASLHLEHGIEPGTIVQLLYRASADCHARPVASIQPRQEAYNALPASLLDTAARSTDDDNPFNDELLYLRIAPQYGSELKIAARHLSYLQPGDQIEFREPRNFDGVGKSCYLSRFVGLFLPNLPCADKYDTVLNRESIAF